MMPDPLIKQLQIGDNTYDIGVKAENVENLSKSEIGLSNVDNTSDLDKPISTATQTALNEKQNTLTFDTTPTSGSTNPVTSGGVYAALAHNTNIFYAEYGVTTFGEIKTAFDAGAMVICKYTYNDDGIKDLIFLYFFDVYDNDDPYQYLFSNIDPYDYAAAERRPFLYVATVSEPASGETVWEISEHSTALQKALTFDSAPTSGSTNPVTSGGVYTAINNAINAAIGGSY